MMFTTKNYQEIFDSNNLVLKELSLVQNDIVIDAAHSLSSSFEERKKTADLLLKDNNILKIGVVGQVKAGKSSFLNALFFNGESILPKASTPMTAGLTVLKYGEKNKFIVEYYSESEWQTFIDDAEEYDQSIKEGRAAFPGLTDSEIEKEYRIDERLKCAKELVFNCSRIAKQKIEKKSKTEETSFADIQDLQGVLHDFVGAKGTFTSVVKCLTIELNDIRLKSLQIVDTPGVNDPVKSREQRTREFLRESHGVLFLSKAFQFFNSTDVMFLEDRIGSQGIGTVVVLANQFDEALMDEADKYRNNLQDAAYNVFDALYNQFKHNISGSCYAGNEPKVDFSSGLCYSVASKKKSDWDADELHIVERMKKLFPSSFKNDDDIVNVFSVLSNVEDIRNKYIENDFIKNKDKIIESKMTSYFAGISTELQKIVKLERERLVNSLEMLENGDVKGRRIQLNKMLESIKKEILTIASLTDSKSKEEAKKTYNSYFLNWDGKVPQLSTQLSVTRKSTIWENKKSFSMTAFVPNIDKLIQVLIGELETSIEKMSKNWDKSVKDIRDFLNESLNDFIIDCQKSNHIDDLDARTLSNAVAVVLQDMKVQTTIDVRGFIRSKREELSQILQGFDHIKQIGFDSMSQEEAETKVKNQSDSLIRDVQRYCRSQLAAIEKEIQDILNKSADDAISCVNQKKDEFIEKIEQNVKTQLDSVEKQICQFEKNKNHLSRALQIIDKIKL